MENKPEPTTAASDAMTPEQAEAISMVIRATAQELGPYVRDMQAQTHRHAEAMQAASNEAARRMAIPASIIAMGVSLFAGIAALGALFVGEYQLSREILLPLLSFAGGLGIGARLLK